MTVEIFLCTHSRSRKVTEMATATGTEMVTGMVMEMGTETGTAMVTATATATEMLVAVPVTLAMAALIRGVVPILEIPTAIQIQATMVAAAVTLAT